MTPTFLIFQILAGFVAIMAIPLPKANTVNSSIEKILSQSDDGPVNQNTDQLIFVQAVWRHGDRSPYSTYKTDKYQEDHWPQGFGQLSVRGMKQHFQLGQKLRQRYVNDLKFVSPSYKSKEIYVRSTDWNRTVMSAISNFIGFYADGNNPDDHPQVEGWPGNFVPVPIHTVERKEDTLGNLGAEMWHCPRREKIYNLQRETPEFKQLFESNQGLFDTLSNFTGENIIPENIEAIQVIWDTLFVEKNYDVLPDWYTEELYQNITVVENTIRNWSIGTDIQPYKSVDFATELPPLVGGPLLWKFIDQMKAKSECDAKIGNESTNKTVESCNWINHLKYFVYSAHDQTLSALSSALGLKNSAFNKGGNPYYSTAVTVEMWKSANDTYSVKVLLWDPLKDNFDELTRTIAGCENGCSLEQFVERSKPYKPTPSIRELCEKNLPSGAFSVLPSASLLLGMFFALTTASRNLFTF